MFSKILRFFKKETNTESAAAELKNRILDSAARGETKEAVNLIRSAGHQDAALWHARWVSGQKAFEAGDCDAESWQSLQSIIHEAILDYCNPDEPVPDEIPESMPDVPVTQEQCTAVANLVARHQTAEALQICRNWGRSFLLVTKQFQETRRMWYLGIIDESRRTELQKQVDDALLQLLEIHPKKGSQ